jgi:hypothetical protein
MQLYEVHVSKRVSHDEESILHSRFLTLTLSHIEKFRIRSVSLLDLKTEGSFLYIGRTHLIVQGLLGLE